MIFTDKNVQKIKKLPAWDDDTPSLGVDYVRGVLRYIHKAPDGFYPSRTTIRACSLCSAEWARKEAIDRDNECYKSREVLSEIEKDKRGKDIKHRRSLNGAFEEACKFLKGILDAGEVAQVEHNSDSAVFSVKDMSTGDVFNFEYDKVIDNPESFGSYTHEHAKYADIF